MAGRICNVYANALLAAALPAGSFSGPTHWNLALSTADPLADGSALAEPSGGSYARQQVDAWTPNTGARSIANTAQITFPTATGNWGTISHFAIIDNTGAFVASGPLTASVAVPSGITFVIAAGAAVVDIA